MGSPSTYSRVRLERYDAEALQEIITGADLDHVLLEPGPSSASVEQVETPQLVLNRGKYSFPVRVRGRFPAGRICIGMVDEMGPPTWINGHNVGAGNLQIYSEGSELFYRAHSRASWATIAVARDHLQAVALRQLGRNIVLPESGVTNLHPSPAAYQWLKRAIVITLEDARSQQDSQALSAEIDLVIAGACVAAIASSSVASREGDDHHSRIITGADQVMRRHIGYGYASEFFCRALGVSERVLQLHFSRGLGLSPKAWFRRLALHEARKRLKQMTPYPGAVTEVALKCGFEHFGRFSKDFRELFGEPPSSFLRRG